MTASAPSSSATNQNQLVGLSHDLSGNTMNDGAYTYTYNAEGEMTSVAGVNYTYDGDGNRVQKSNGKIYWYGAGTEILDESNLSGNFTDEYIFFGGKRVVHVAMSSGNVYYYAEDFLGSSRVITDSQGNVCYEADFDPYGAEWAIITSCPQNYKFQGKERDAETNNDDFGARYYSSRLGRWLSADWSSVPAPVPYANLTNPQTLNLYAMVSDNPETFADLDGHILPSPEGKDTASPANPCINGNSSMYSGAATNSTAQPTPAQNQAGKENLKGTMSLSSNGLDFIKQHESFSATVYNDEGGNPTIGYGHKTNGENFGQGITREQATDLLSQDTMTAVKAVNNNLKVSVSQSQFDSLVDLAFNAGAGALARSPALANINSAKDVGETDFTQYRVRTGGHVSQGLINRRTDEYNLFESGETHGP